MATNTLEERVAAVESELTRLKQQLTEGQPQSPAARWEGIFGSFANSEGFEEAARLGREYREEQNNQQSPIS